MTISNIAELVILVCSVLVVMFMVKRSNRKVKDLDGLGNVVKKKDEKGIVIAHF